MAMVVRRIPLSEEGMDDILFWQQQTSSARFAEAERLRRQYHIWKDGFFPQHIEKVARKVSRDEHFKGF
jgi:hypothetical protein